MTELRGKIEPGPMRSLASGSAQTALDSDRQCWLIQNCSNIALTFQGRGGRVVTIQPGEEAEV
jgi:hypothetical protein